MQYKTIIHRRQFINFKVKQFGTMHEKTLQNVTNDKGTSSLSYLYDTKPSSAVHPVSIHQEKENQPVKPLTPVLTGTGNVTHNISRMLGDSTRHPANLLPYNMTHSMSFRHGDDLHEDISQHTIDVSNSDISISTEGSISPKSSSVGSLSPVSSIELSIQSDTPQTAESPTSATSSPNNCEKPRKKARTNFSKEQVQALLKIFHENPYPDSDMMEDIGKNLNITEKQVKIWFQNKRARWRRRNDNQNNQPQSFLTTPHMLSPVVPYGFTPNGHMMTSFPLQNITGYNNYNWKQGPLSPNNNQQLLGQFSTNQIPSRYQTANQNASLHNETVPGVYMTPAVSSLASTIYNSRPMSQHMMNYNRQPSQFPHHIYQTMNTLAS